MADEKGGGGSGWGTFEIVLGILLLIGLLERFSGSSHGLFQNNQKDAPAVLPADTTAPCGLSIARPEAEEKITGAITLAGTAGYCNWQAHDGIALYAQAVDSKGRPVSAYTKVAATGISGDRVSFRTIIPLTVSPSKGVGYLILVPARQENSPNTISTRIPIKF